MDTATYMASSECYPSLQPFVAQSVVLKMLRSSGSSPMSSTKTWLGCVGLKAASINIERYLGRSSAFLDPHGKVSHSFPRLKTSQLAVTYICL